MTAYSSQATIRRAPHGEDKYFQMRRDTAQDRTLSWEARGMISYILSHKDDWDIRVHDLMQNCQKGRVYRILDELKTAGYLEDRKKYRDEKGKWQWTPYILHERPITNVIEMPKPVVENPYPEKQDTDNPYPDFRDTEKRDTENAEIKELNTDIPNTDNNILPMEEPSATDGKAVTAKPRTPAQLHVDNLVEALGKAFGVMAMGNDYTMYAKVAKTLEKATIPMTEFPQYVKRLRRIAEKQKWTASVTITSLIGKGRPSEYVAARDAYQKQTEQPVQNKSAHDPGVDLMLSWLKGDKTA